MAVLKKQLDPDEEVLVETNPHWIFVAKPVAVTVATVGVVVAVVVASHYSSVIGHLPVAVLWLLVAVAAVPTLWLAVCVLRWRTTSLVVTSSRLIVRRGAFGRQAMQIRLNRVNEVGYQQTLLERLLRTGRLLVETGGEDGVQVFPCARRPAVLQRVINHQLDVVQGGLRPPGGGPVPAGPAWQGAGPDGPPTAPPAASYAPAARLLPDAPTDPGIRRAGGQAPPFAGPGGGQPASSAPPAGEAPAFAHPPGAAPQPGIAPGIPEQILQLDELRRRGLLTDDEFQAKKTELLGRM